MGILDKVTGTLSKGVANAEKAVAGAAVSLSTSTGNIKGEAAGLKAQLDAVEQKLALVYSKVGRKYITCLREGGDMANLDVADEMKELEPLFDHQKELRDRLAPLQEKIDADRYAKDKENAEKKFQSEKEKLDKALSSGAIQQEEYDEKLAKAQKRLDCFDQLRQIDQWLDDKLITKEERDAKVAELLGE